MADSKCSGNTRSFLLGVWKSRATDPSKRDAMNYIIVALGIEDTKPYENSEGGKAEVSWNVGGKGNWIIGEPSFLISHALSVLATQCGPRTSSVCGTWHLVRNVGCWAPL